MARPKKVRTDIMDDTMVEVLKEEDAPVTNSTEDVIIAEATVLNDVVTPLTAEIVKPKDNGNEARALPKPIYDIDELTDEDKQVLIEKKVKSIIEQTQIPSTYALCRFREPETTAVPPMWAVLEFDHRYVNDAWEFYKTNVRNPWFKDFMNLVTQVTGKPSKIYPSLVVFNYE